MKRDKKNQPRKTVAFADMSGAYSAMFTPFDAKGRVDPEKIAQLVEYGLANGLRGFYLTGTSGEWWLLSNDERKTVMDAAVAASKGRAKLIAHVGANSTADAVALARHAAKIGIDWISAVTPQLYSTSFEATHRHYRAISSATDLPFLAYSFGAALVPDRDARLFDLPNVKGIKYTGRDYFAAQALKRRLSKETLWFAGCDEQLLCALALGDVFAGGIGTTYNVIPRHYAKICRLAADGDFAGAAKLQAEANRVTELMIEPENWSYRKAMMRCVGIDCGFYRMPFGLIPKRRLAAWEKRVEAALATTAPQAALVGRVAPNAPRRFEGKPPYHAGPKPGFSSKAIDRNRRQSTDGNRRQSTAIESNRPHPNP